MVRESSKDFMEIQVDFLVLKVPQVLLIAGAHAIFLCISYVTCSQTHLTSPWIVLMFSDTKASINSQKSHGTGILPLLTYIYHPKSTKHTWIFQDAGCEKNG